MAITISEICQFINEVVGAASKEIDFLKAENLKLSNELEETKSRLTKLGSSERRFAEQGE